MEHQPPTLPTVVIATRNRRQRLLTTLERLSAIDDPRVVVVDDGSTDGTAAAVRHRFPDVSVVAGRSGTAPRTLGVEAAETPLVAFNDDDSWWSPGALRRTVEQFGAYPRLGLVAARVIVEPGGHLDPTCLAMRDSPLRATTPLPGPPVLGFVACGAVARRSAVLECGGFHGRYGFGGEEELLAIDLAAAGWELCYAEDVVAHHEPDPGPRPRRQTRQQRNGLWSAWLRRPLPSAARLTIAAACDRGGIRAVGAALTGLPWVLQERRVVPAHVEHALRALENPI